MGWTSEIFQAAKVAVLQTRPGCWATVVKLLCLNVFAVLTYMMWFRLRSDPWGPIQIHTHEFESHYTSTLLILQDMRLIFQDEVPPYSEYVDCVDPPVHM